MMSGVLVLHFEAHFDGGGDTDQKRLSPSVEDLESRFGDFLEDLSGILDFPIRDHLAHVKALLLKLQDVRFSLPPVEFLEHFVLIQFLFEAEQQHWLDGIVNDLGVLDLDQVLWIHRLMPAQISELQVVVLEKVVLELRHDVVAFQDSKLLQPYWFLAALADLEMIFSFDEVVSRGE